MEAVIQKWGNSNAIRLPKVLLNNIGIKENDVVLITPTDNGFIINKTNHHKTLKERLEEYYKKPIDEIEKIQSEEIDWGKPVGEEAW